MEVLSTINAWFWKDIVGLAPTWEEYGLRENIRYGKFEDMYYALPIAILLSVLRWLLEKFLFIPIGTYFGLKHRAPFKPDNQLLERVLLENGKVSSKQIQGLAKQLDWSERKVERWIRKRNASSKSSTLTKFTESAWRFTFYLFATIYGFYVLWDKTWLATSYDCFYNLPHHNVTNDVWFFYVLELGFYSSHIISLLKDTKKKDFGQMFVHHVNTIVLVSFSWTCNIFRLGVFTLLIHDIGDIPLEAAKMTNYVKKQALANVSFVIFTLVWIVTRLILLPCRVLYFTMYKTLHIPGFFPAYYIINTLLLLVQSLQIMWTWMIIKTISNTICSSEFKDARSDSEDEENSDDSAQTDIKENFIQGKKYQENNCYYPSGCEQNSAREKGKPKSRF